MKGRTKGLRLEYAQSSVDSSLPNISGSDLKKSQSTFHTKQVEGPTVVRLDLGRVTDKSTRKELELLEDPAFLDRKFDEITNTGFFKKAKFKLASRDFSGTKGLLRGTTIKQIENCEVDRSGDQTVSERMKTDQLKKMIRKSLSNQQIANFVAEKSKKLDEISRSRRTSVNSGTGDTNKEAFSVENGFNKQNLDVLIEEYEGRDPKDTMVKQETQESSLAPDGQPSEPHLKHIPKGPFKEFLKSNLSKITLGHPRTFEQFAFDSIDRNNFRFKEPLRLIRGNRPNTMTVSELHSVDQKIELTQTAHSYNDRLKVGSYNYVKDPALKLELIPSPGMAGNETIKDRIRQNLRNSDQLAHMRAAQWASQEKVSQVKNYSREMIKFQSKKTLERIKNRLTNLVFIEPKQESREGLVERLMPGSAEKADKPSAVSKVYFRQTRSSNLLRTFNRTAKSPGLSSTGASSNGNKALLTGDSFFQTNGSFGLGFPRFEGPDRVIPTSTDLKSPVSPRKLRKQGSRKSVVDPDIQGELARVSSTFHMVKLIEDIGSLRQENKLFSEELMKVEMEAERREKKAKSKILRKERIQGCYEALQPTQRARELLIEAGASLQPELVP